MTVTAPKVTQNIKEGQLGAVASTSGRLLTIMGCSSAGPLNSPRKFAGGQVQRAVDTFGDGPGVEMLSLILKAGIACVFVRLPSTAPGTAGVDGVNGLVTFTGTGTSVITVTGAALDSFEAVVEFINGGTIATAGITFRYSLDGGRNFSPVIALGTANTYAIPRSGVSLAFGAGTIAAGAKAVFLTKEPKWAGADLAAAFAGLAASSHVIRGVHVVGSSTVAEAGAAKTEIVAAEAAFRYQFVILEARPVALTGLETEAAWMAAIVTEFASFSSTRVGVGAGKLWIVSPISARQYLRPVAWAAVARLARVPVHRDLGRVKDGPLDATIVDTNGVLIGHDERVVPGLNDARFITATTIVGKDGVFITNPLLMAPAGSDFELLQYRAVMDVACAVTYDKLADLQSEDVLVGKTGRIDEKTAKAFESDVTDALNLALTKQGSVSSARYVLSREDDILATKKLTGETRIRPLGYVKELVNEIGFENPKVVLG